jgi:sugar lactone lactonase YvrE
VTAHALTTVHTGVDFAEGPRWHDGRLWFSDFYRHGVFTLETDGTETRRATVEAQPSGLGWMPDGTLLVVSMLDQKLLAVRGDAEPTLHADLAGVATGTCNDMVVGADGTAYVGSFGFDLMAGESPRPATLTRVTPEAEVHLAAADLQFPNGSVITPDGSTLIVGETVGGRYTAWDIASDGSLSGRRLWADVGGHMPDGCCLDADGAIWMADVGNRQFCRVHEGGAISDTIAVEGYAVACTLGGDDGRTLYMLVSPGTRPEQVRGIGGSSIVTTRVEVGGAGRP